MSGTEQEYRLYRDLADWWPLISPKEEYTAEARYLAAVLAAAGTGIHQVLDLGSGGGHMAVHLRDDFQVTMVDISAEMLAVSERLNPGSEHIQGDMRSVRLARSFDAVLVHDAIDYITTGRDLRQVIDTAYAHCRPGGLALFVPDYVKDTFREIAGSGGGGDDGSGRHASFREWTWDPDPADDWVQAEYEFTLGAVDGTEQIIREKHRLGAFSAATWHALLAAAGFTAVSGPEPGAAPSRNARGAQPAAPGALPGTPPEHLFSAWRPPEPGADRLP